jgi:ATP phosphoribosyltransferase-like protein
MRENRLKTIAGGAVIKSQACIIANREMIINERVKLDQCKLFLERIEAYLRSNKYFTLTANMTGENPEQIASIISKGSITDGLKGPTISKVYNTSESDLYSVTMIISKDNLMKTVSSMRKIGAETVSVYKLDYLFDCESDSIKTLLGKSES